MKELIKRLTPPILVDWARAFAGSNNGIAGWEFAGSDWPEGLAADDIWRRPEILATARSDYLATVARLNEGSLAETAEAHNTYMTFAYALARTCSLVDKARPLRVLDFGGGCGIYCNIARSLMPEFEFDWHVRELTSLCGLGRSLNPNCIFHDRNGPLPHPTYDFVLASGSLQYCRDWRSELAQIVSAAAGPFLLTRLPVSDVNSFVVTQNALIGSERVRIPHWVLRADEVARAVGRPVRREFHLHGPTPIHGADSGLRFAGFLFDAPEPPR